MYSALELLEHVHCIIIIIVKEKKRKYVLFVVHFPPVFSKVTQTKVRYIELQCSSPLPSTEQLNKLQIML